MSQPVELILWASAFCLVIVGNLVERLHERAERTEHERFELESLLRFHHAKDGTPCPRCHEYARLMKVLGVRRSELEAVVKGNA